MPRLAALTFSFAEGFAEQRAIFGDRVQPRDDRLDRLVFGIRIPAHLLERFDRLQGLVLETPHAHVPEHRRRGRRIPPGLVHAVETDIQHGRAVALHERDRVGRLEPAAPAEACAVHADRDVAVFGIARARMMAARARDIAMAREDRIPEQELAERHLVGRKRIVRRRIHALGQCGEGILPLALAFGGREEEQHSGHQTAGDNSVSLPHGSQTLSLPPWRLKRETAPKRTDHRDLSDAPNGS